MHVLTHVFLSARSRAAPQHGPLGMLCVVCWTDQHHSPLPAGSVRGGSCFQSLVAPALRHNPSRVRSRWGPECGCGRLASASGLQSRRSSAVATLRSCRRCWMCASWSAGTSRRKHACADWPVRMSGGACFCLLCSCRPLRARPAPRPVAARECPHREALLKVLCSSEPLIPSCSCRHPFVRSVRLVQSQSCALLFVPRSCSFQAPLPCNHVENGVIDRQDVEL